MSDKDYDVGYGRTPKNTRFKKGQSGNPKGRKKGDRALKSDMRAELNERVQITENGRTVKLTKQQLVIKRLVAKAIKGDIRAISKLMDTLAAWHGPEDEARKNATVLSADDEAIINDWLSWKNIGKTDD